MKFLTIVLTVLVATGFTSPSEAQGYPLKPVRWIVPFAPGGASDILARTVGTRLAERLGQPVVIENKPGAATTIGAELVARSAPDGYTLLLAPSASVVAQYVYPKLGFGEKDFAAVSLLGYTPMLIAVHPSVAAKSVAELVALAKSKPGALAYSSPGSGSVPHLTGEMFRLRAGIELTHVPYKGGGPAVADLVAGQVALTFANPPELLSHVRSGRLTLLATATLKRLPYLPEIPTLHESGYANFEVLAWFGVLARAGTPAEIVARLASDLAASLKQPDVAERLAGLGLEAVGNTPGEFAAFLRIEHAKWAEAVRAAGVKID
ncbi:MAG: tripartite tricarboxylate transporter substrate binding protein [Betaproteobacteria bacterium]|nr:tripartite tricarboxylate transporter substrate binding protein [Betaproteobacteria bacterium]